MFFLSLGLLFAQDLGCEGALNPPHGYVRLLVQAFEDKLLPLERLKEISHSPIPVDPFHQVAVTTDSLPFHKAFDQWLRSPDLARDWVWIRKQLGREVQQGTEEMLVQEHAEEDTEDVLQFRERGLVGQPVFAGLSKAHAASSPTPAIFAFGIPNPETIRARSNPFLGLVRYIPQETIGAPVHVLPTREGSLLRLSFEGRKSLTVEDLGSGVTWLHRERRIPFDPAAFEPQMYESGDGRLFLSTMDGGVCYVHEFTGGVVKPMFQHSKVILGRERLRFVRGAGQVGRFYIDGAVYRFGIEVAEFEFELPQGEGITDWDLIELADGSFLAAGRTENHMRFFSITPGGVATRLPLQMTMGLPFPGTRGWHLSPAGQAFYFAPTGTGFEVGEPLAGKKVTVDFGASQRVQAARPLWLDLPNGRSLMVASANFLPRILVIDPSVGVVDTLPYSTLTSPIAWRDGENLVLALSDSRKPGYFRLFDVYGTVTSD